MTDGKFNKVGRYDLVTPMLACKDEIMAGFERFLTSGRYILGEEVRLLEEEMAAACAVTEAVGVSSGSSALYLALAVAGVGPDDEVITTPYTFEATIEAIIRLGAVPVFVDICATDLNLNPELIEAAITDRTKAICPVHIFGAPCDMKPILAIAEKHGLEVVVDMAQAFGTLYDGRPCGSFGRMSSLSFYPTKNLPGVGDGGLILCQSEEDAHLLRKLRAHVPIRLGERLVTGFNWRLDEVQAMVVRIRLARFADEQIDRDAAARIYDEHIPVENRLQAPNGVSGIRVTHHQYWLRSRFRDQLRQRLTAHGIDTGAYYHPPLHRQALAEFCNVSGTLPEAERAGAEILTLPIHASLAEDDALRIAHLVQGFLQETAR